MKNWILPNVEVYFSAGLSSTPPIEVSLRPKFHRTLIAVLTEQRPKQKTQISSESKIAERSSLRMLRAVLTKHSAHSDNSARKNARKASSKNHLPQRLTHSKQRRSNSDAKQRRNQNRLPSPFIRSLEPSANSNLQHHSDSIHTFPQKIITHICVALNKLSIKPE